MTNSQKTALMNFVSAAEALNEAWGTDADTFSAGYPDYLPSFDEFFSDLVDWKCHYISTNAKK